ncbi:hypothetical protein ACSBR2_020988 [Camellia fascicularis]
MPRDISIPPEIQHYGCMVDLLCKAGLIKDALELIESMRIVPNSIIWGALLSGCQLYKNLEIAQVAVNKLMDLEPNNSGYYILLVNMYVESNRWNEVAKIRTTIKVQGIEKTSPGSSWIEMDGKIHLFAASDKCHPYLAKIYVVLGEREGQLKLAGYQPKEMSFEDIAFVKQIQLGARDGLEARGQFKKHNDGPTSAIIYEEHIVKMLPNVSCALSIYQLWEDGFQARMDETNEGFQIYGKSKMRAMKG